MGRNESGGRRGELNAFFAASSQRYSTMMAHSTNVDSASLGFDKKRGAHTYVVVVEEALQKQEWEEEKKCCRESLLVRFRKQK